MPSEAETKCACCGEVKPCPLRRDDMGGYVCLTCIDAALSAASAVRSEGVKPGTWDDARINDWMGRHDVVLPNPAYDELRSMTSPVQTREDGIREAASRIEGYIIEEQPGDVKTVLARKMVKSILALLSQPEPKGDKHG